MIHYIPIIFFRIAFSLGELIENFASEISSLTDAALEEFDASAKWYDQTIVAGKRKLLIGKLESVVSPLFARQLKLIEER